jgi:hypothetical protein
MRPDQCLAHSVAAGQPCRPLVRFADCAHVAPFELPLFTVEQPGGPEHGLDLRDLQERRPGGLLRQDAVESSSGFCSIQPCRFPSFSTVRTAASTLLIELLDSPRRRRLWIRCGRGSVYSSVSGCPASAAWSIPFALPEPGLTAHQGVHEHRDASFRGQLQQICLDASEHNRFAERDQAVGGPARPGTSPTAV